MINNSLYKVETPNLNPVVDKYEYVDWWKEQKKRCIEGYWQSGQWIPGPLYYFINFHPIELEDPTGNLKIGLPWLRDNDWEELRIFEEARGFSGFSDDKENTCHRFYGPDKEKALEFGWITEEELKTKTYVPAREYLKRIDKDLGKPLYENSASHMISMQSRGGGKSFRSSAVISHNFLFDGATDYDVHFNARKAGSPMNSDTIVGAIHTQFTEPLLSKVTTAWDYMPGRIEYLGNTYVSPLLIGYGGSLQSGKREYTSKFKSKLRHRTFNDSPFAANATRPNLAVLDEVGFMHNIQEVWGALEATQTSRQYKKLVIWALGTGGLVGGKAANFVEPIFYNPEEYGCLVFNDDWENRGKIGYFVPYTHTLNMFKEGENYITNEDKALKYVNDKRKKAQKSKDASVYRTEVINGPIKPSEVFLTIEGGYFPTIELKEQEAMVLSGTHKKQVDASFKGWPIIKEDNVVDFETVQDAKPIRTYPLTKDYDPKGCVEIWQKPYTENGVIPYGLYIAGIDVVDKASSTTSSLPSMFIMNRLTRQIVCEYTGRTQNPKFFYETCRKLLKYYNATGMYEQNLTGLFTHFEQKKSLHLLADTPKQLQNRETFIEGSNTSKGITATERVNSTGRNFIKSWLIQPLSENAPDGDKILNTIYSPALLKELIMWNKHGNFDRVSALIMLLWHDETSRVDADNFKNQEKKKTFLENDYFKEMGLYKTKEQYSPFEDSLKLNDEL